MRSCGFLLLLASLVPAQAVHGDKYRGGIVTPPLPKPAFILTGTPGAPYDFRKRTEGPLTLLFFGYTSCPDACPMRMANIGVALKKLPPGISGRVKLVSSRPIPNGTPPWRRAAGWTISIRSLSGSGEQKRLLKPCRRALVFPLPAGTNCATATVQSPTPTSLSPTAEITWPT
jgi:hypothetical protein